MFAPLSLTRLVISVSFLFEFFPLVLTDYVLNCVCCMIRRLSSDQWIDLRTSSEPTLMWVEICFFINLAHL